MDAQTAARILGGRARGNRVSCPGPNHSKSDQSLTVIFTPDGLIVHSFSTRDDWKECKDYVKTKLGIADDWRPDPAKIKPEQDADTRNHDFAMEIWSQSRPAHGTVVTKYLSSRNIELPTDVECIRYHPGLKYDGARYEAMVTIYVDIATNEPRGVHRTFLRPDGTKLDRRMLGSAKGAAIKLDDDENITYGIHVGEGIETCLSARQLGFAPIWALMSAQGINDFPVREADALTILGEKDPMRTNEIACKNAARRWLSAGKEVHIRFPRDGNDMNDAVRHG